MTKLEKQQQTAIDVESYRQQLDAIRTTVRQFLDTWERTSQVIAALHGPKQDGVSLRDLRKERVDLAIRECHWIDELRTLCGR